MLDPELLEPVPLLEPLPELELPMPLLLGEWVLLLPDVLGVELLGEDDELLLLGELLLEVPPLEELLPDLLKCASHSAREMEPSLFLSTDENDGVELLELAPLEALGEDDEEEELGEAALGVDELLEAPPEALPEDLLLPLELGLEVDGLELDGLELEEPLLLPVLCAAATPASARSAADVAATTTFNIIWNSS